jgi:glycosyltransferase involved in cell wall biosynthesis
MQTSILNQQKTNYPMPGSGLPLLSIVLPCYNEEEVLETSANTLEQLVKSLIDKKLIDQQSFIVFVDDGSRDSTWNVIEHLHTNKPDLFRGIKLSNNFGHQGALLAGLFSVEHHVDCAVTIDADLQDDYTVIEQMLMEFSKGAAIVYGVRSSRKKDTFWKRFTAEMFYKLMLKMRVKTVFNHADFRLVSRKVIHELTRYQEVNLYLRGIFPLMGFPSSMVYYERKERMAGETKYPFKKMVSFALEGITSFSAFPLRFIFFMGFIIFLASLVLMIWAFIPVFTGKAVHGWVSTVVPIFFFGGLQMISLGIIGEYLGKIYKEVKGRPRFIIDKEI